MNPNNATPAKQPIGVSSQNPFDTTTGQRLITPVDGNTPTVQTTPIDASIIGTTTPLTIPQNNPTTAQNNLSATVAGHVQPENTAITDTTQTDTPTNSRQPILEQIKSLIGLENNKGAETARLQDNQDIAGKTQAVNEINNKLLTASRGYDEQIKTLQKSGTGYNGGNEVAIADLTRRKNEDLANLSIIKATTLGDLDTANTIVDQKLKAEFEPIEANIKNYEELYNLTSNDLTDSEKLTIQTQIDQKKQTAQNLYNAKQDAYKTALENGAPANVLAAIGSAATPEAAQQAVGSYGQNPLDQQLKRAQIANTYSEIASRNNSGNENGTLNGKPQNASQSTAQSYGNRMSEANITLDQLGGKFTGLGTTTANILGGLVPNFLKGGDRQAVEQAQKNFVTAVLRRESGASISPSEFSTAAEVYFPQPGDTQSTIETKAQTRNTVINNFYREANVARPVLPGQIIESKGKKYQVGTDGQSLTAI